MSPISGVFLANPDGFPVLPPPGNGRGGVALGPAGQGHPHALSGQRVGAAVLVDDVRRNWNVNDSWDSLELISEEAIFYLKNHSLSCIIIFMFLLRINIKTFASFAINPRNERMTG